jgi:hypothetical protein
MLPLCSRARIVSSKIPDWTIGALGIVQDDRPTYKSLVHMPVPARGLSRELWT